MLAWAAAGACLAGAVALLVRRQRDAVVLPLADGRSFAAAARRSWTVWVGLAAVLVVLLLVFTVRARAQGTERRLLQPGVDAVVVIDLSSSTRSASKGIAHALSTLTSDPKRRLGLIVFSNGAYEALPPSTPADGLKGWLDRFADGAPKTYPWTSFSNGTAISKGLVLARRIVRRDHVISPHVILVSDLADTESDLEKLQTAIAQYQREAIDLKIVKVNRRGPTAPFVPDSTFVERAASATVEATGSAGSGSSTVVLAALVAALGLLVALHELAFHPFAWRART